MTIVNLRKFDKIIGPYKVSSLKKNGKGELGLIVSESRCFV